LRGIGYRPDNCVVTDDPIAFAAALQAAAANIRDVDGSAFHRRQLKALDAAIGHGLEKLGAVRQEVAA
ncbi:glycosyl transferase, partial [Mesorhizobium sp. M2A.F.Ca.ET.040.01.1.1]